MWLDNDRISHWLAGAVFSWLTVFLLLGLPVFHFWLKVPPARIAIFVGICCAMQLAVTPWLFSARSDSRNPAGRVLQRAAVVVILLSAITLMLFYYLRILNLISVVVVVAFALVMLAKFRFWP